MVETTAVLALSAAAAIVGTAFAAAWAEKAIGTAAMGAMTEKDGLFGSGLVLTVLPETIVIFGLVIAIMIMTTLAH